MRTPRVDCDADFAKWKSTWPVVATNGYFVRNRTQVIPHTHTEKQFNHERLEAEKRLADLIAELREYTLTETEYTGVMEVVGIGQTISKADVAVILDRAEQRD